MLWLAGGGGLVFTPVIFTPTLALSNKMVIDGLSATKNVWHMIDSFYDWQTIDHHFIRQS